MSVGILLHWDTYGSGLQAPYSSLRNNFRAVYARDKTPKRVTDLVSVTPPVHFNTSGCRKFEKTQWTVLYVSLWRKTSFSKSLFDFARALLWSGLTIIFTNGVIALSDLDIYFRTLWNLSSFRFLIGRTMLHRTVCFFHTSFLFYWTLTYSESW